MTNGTTDVTSAIVPVKSAWWSKINWVAFVGLAAAILSIWNISIPEDTQEAIIKIGTAVTEVVVPAVVIILRTSYTTTVTKSSVSSAPTINQSKPVAQVTPVGEVASTV